MKMDLRILDRGTLLMGVVVLLGGFTGKGVGVKLKEAHMSMELSGKEWSLAEYDDQSEQVVYIYKREPLFNVDGIPVVPNISVLIEELPLGVDVVSFSASKRLSVPFDVDRVLTHQSGDLKFKNAIGYEGHYMDNGRQHTVLVVHAINGLYGLQLICDVTSDLFETVAPEFRQTLLSLR